jgi:hypothetical protein
MFLTSFCIFNNLDRSLDGSKGKSPAVLKLFTINSGLCSSFNQYIRPSLLNQFILFTVFETWSNVVCFISNEIKINMDVDSQIDHYFLIVLIKKATTIEMRVYDSMVKESYTVAESCCHKFTELIGLDHLPLELKIMSVPQQICVSHTS